MSFEQDIIKVAEQKLLKLAASSSIGLHPSVPMRSDAAISADTPPEESIAQSAIDSLSHRFNTGADSAKLYYNHTFDRDLDSDIQGMASYVDPVSLYHNINAHSSNNLADSMQKRILDTKAGQADARVRNNSIGVAAQDTPKLKGKFGIGDAKTLFEPDYRSRPRQKYIPFAPVDNASGTREA